MIRSFAHPERSHREVYIGNYHPEHFHCVGFRSARVGRTAYDVHGRVVPGLYPMFVNDFEFMENLKDGIQRYKTLVKDVAASLQKTLDAVIAFAN